MTDRRLMSKADLRRVAEEQVGQVQDGQESISAEEAARTLHELRVHQVELEMQNEELRRTQLELAASQARYQELFDVAPVGYLSVDEEGRIVEVNLTAATMLRVPRSALLGRMVSAFIASQQGDDFHRFRMRRLASLDAGTMSDEFRLAREYDDTFWVRLDSTVATTAEGATQMRITMTDISRLVLAEKIIRRDFEERERLVDELRLQTTLLRKAGRLAHLGSWRIETQSGERIWSEEMYRIFDISPSVTGPELDQAVRRCVHPEDLDNLGQVDLALAADGEPEPRDYRIRTRGGTVRWVHAEGARELDASGKLTALTGFIQDITQRKQDENLRAMTKKVMDALGKPTGLHEAAAAVLLVLQSGMEADGVAIRLKSGTIFPYYAYEGFTEEFIAAENAMLVRSRDQADMQESALDRCLAKGYISTVLIPIRDTHGVIGLLQVNDRRAGRFTPVTVEVLETIAAYLGAVLAAIKAEEQLAACSDDAERSDG